MQPLCQFGQVLLWSGPEPQLRWHHPEKVNWSLDMHSHFITFQGSLVLKVTWAFCAEVPRMWFPRIRSKQLSRGWPGTRTSFSSLTWATASLPLGSARGVANKAAHMCSKLWHVAKSRSLLLLLCAPRLMRVCFEKLLCVASSCGFEAI